MPEQRVEQQPPDVLAVVLADTILRDMATGKLYIQGTYSVIVAQTFPYQHPSIAVYFAITSGHGKTPIKMRLIDVDETRAPVFEQAMDFDFPDPLAVVEGVFVAVGPPFPEPGEYRLQVFGAGQLLRERRLQVVPAPAPPEAHDTTPPQEEPS
jgi:hypothetical protein